MKVAMYYDQEDIRCEDLPIPKVRTGEILVRMKACGVCGSDLMGWYLKDRAPLVLGHEPSGVVTEVGEAVEDLEEGDRVFVHHHIACLRCNYCIRGAYTLCSEFKRTNIAPGGFAEYFCVPFPNVKGDTLKLPEEVSFEAATLIEPTACCIRALMKCDLQPGDNVLIIGAGPSGIIHEMLLENLGVGLILVSDLINYRLEAAKRFGADAVINPRNENCVKRVKELTNGRGADVVIVTAPNVSALSSGIDACSKGGTVCVFAPTSPREYLQLNPYNLFFSEKRLVSSYSASHIETRIALTLIRSERFKASELITHRFPLSQTDVAFQTAIEDKESLKIVVKG